jgi:DNA-binding GntR family transcriptional regulator
MVTVNHMDIEPMVPMTLADQVRQRLRDWIVSGRLKPGDRLRIQELARKLKVSDTTIREALSRLRQTGLVQSVSWAGTRVMEFTRTDIEEVFDLRRALEPFSVRCGGLNIPEKELLLLKDQIRSAENALEHGESGRAIAVSNELHALILRYTGNSRIVSLLANTYDQIYMFAGLGGQSAEDPRASLRMHHDMVDMLLAKNVDGAARLIETHLEGAKQYALRCYFGGDEAAATR